MQKQNKQKITLVIATGLLLALASPAKAFAPHLTQNAAMMHLALQKPQTYAQMAMKKYKWNKAQFVCLNKVWTNESHWNYKANNPKSTALGIAQMLGETNHAPKVQIDNGLRYIKKRYGQPCTAWKFWRSHYWY
jgi:hypothetical protein